MKITDELIDFISEFEGFRSKPYICPANVLTIGYGHVIKAYEHFTEITIDEAKELLKVDIKDYAKYVYSAFTDLNLKQYQYDALISFAFNCGISALKNSTLKKRIFANDTEEKITDAFKMWDKVTINGKKKVSKGLARRRAREAKLYTTGAYY